MSYRLHVIAASGRWLDEMFFTLVGISVIMCRLPEANLTASLSDFPTDNLIF